jgi:hypothetical protein
MEELERIFCFDIDSVPKSLVLLDFKFYHKTLEEINVQLMCKKDLT